MHFNFICHFLFVIRSYFSSQDLSSTIGPMFYIYKDNNGPLPGFRLLTNGKDHSLFLIAIRNSWIPIFFKIQIYNNMFFLLFFLNYYER